MRHLQMKIMTWNEIDTVRMRMSIVFASSTDCSTSSFRTEYWCRVLFCSRHSPMRSVCVYPFRVSRCFTSHPKPKTNKQTQHRRTPSYIYTNNRLPNDRIIVEYVKRTKIHCQVLQQCTVCEQWIELNLAGLRLSLDCVADTIVMESFFCVIESELCGSEMPTALCTLCIVQCPSNVW